MIEKKFKKYIGLEENLQKSVAILLNLSGLVWFHPPNEIKAKPQYLKKRRAMGVKSGVPDCMILTPRGKYKGLAIELKVGYNKASETQIKWLKKLKKLGYYTVVSYSLNEVRYIIDQYKKGLL